MAAKAQLVVKRADTDTPVKDAQDKLNDYVKRNLPGISVACAGRSAQFADDLQS